MKKSNFSSKTLRLLITSRCPYHCVYCHREGMREITPELLDVADYKYLIGLLHNRYRLEKVTLSGGDPCCKKDVWQIAEAARELKIFCVLVTKGIFLEKFGPIDMVNFSIDTLDKNLYSEITGVPSYFLEKTISNLVEAKSRGIKVSINTVIMKDINDDKNNFENLLSFCSRYKIDEWKLIEEMKLTNGPFCLENFYLEDYARKVGIKANQLKNYKTSLRHRGISISLYRCHCAGVWLTKRYIPESLFLDPAGRILACMHKDIKFDILEDIKSRDSDSIIRVIENIDYEKICPMLNRLAKKDDYAKS